MILIRLVNSERFLYSNKEIVELYDKSLLNKYTGRTDNLAVNMLACEEFAEECES